MWALVTHVVPVDSPKPGVTANTLIKLQVSKENNKAWMWEEEITEAEKSSGKGVGEMEMPGGLHQN